jgi:hypothetical protein
MNQDLLTHICHHRPCNTAPPTITNYHNRQLLCYGGNIPTTMWSIAGPTDYAEHGM